MLVTALGAGQAPLQAGTWAHWDALNYLSIASRGYELYPCAARGQVSDAGPLCGTVAWFGGLPWLMWVPEHLGLPLVASGLAIVRACALGMLLVLWQLLGRRRTPAAMAALVLGAFLPGSVYLHAIFPISLASLGTLVALLALRHRNIALGALGTFVTTAAYSSTPPLAVVLAGWMLLADRAVRPLRRRLADAAALLLAGAAGPAATLLAIRVQTGSWDAFQRLQAQFSYAPSLPWVSFWSRVSPLVRGDTGLVAVEALTILAGVVLAIATVAVALRRDADALCRASAALCVVTLVVPLALNQLSVYRVCALLAPAAVVLGRRRPAGAALVAAVVGVAIAVPLTWFYVQDGLI